MFDPFPATKGLWLLSTAGLNCPFWGIKLWYVCGVSWYPACDWSTVRPSSDHNKNESEKEFPLKNMHYVQYEWEAHREDMKPTSWTPGMSPGWRGQRHWHSLKKNEQILWDKSNSTSNSLRLICILFSIVKFHLWRRKDERVLVAPGSCFLLDTAAVRVLYCLTEKTGLHQGSLKVKHRHRQMESVKWWWWRQERGTVHACKGLKSWPPAFLSIHLKLLLSDCSFENSSFFTPLVAKEESIYSRHECQLLS